MSMNQEIEVEDQMSEMSHIYSNDQYIQTAQQQEGNVPGTTRRRRRKISKSGAGKRKLSSVQVVELERSFEDEHKLDSERKDRLAKELGLDPRQVAVWFQNRRARWKTKKLEEEYSSLKSLYDNSVLHSSQLQSQVVRLTDQLNEAEWEIQRLGEPAEIGSTHSPTSSLSIEVNAEPSFFGDFAVAQDYDNAPGLYAGPNMEYPNMEWMMGGLYM